MIKTQKESTPTARGKRLRIIFNCAVAGFTAVAGLKLYEYLVIEHADVFNENLPAAMARGYVRDHRNDAAQTVMKYFSLTDEQKRSLVDAATTRKNIDMILVLNDTPGLTELQRCAMLDAVLKSGRFDEARPVLDRLSALGEEGVAKVFARRTKEKDFPAIKWLVAQGEKAASSSLLIAAGDKNIDLFRYLIREAGAPAYQSARVSLVADSERYPDPRVCFRALVTGVQTNNKEYFSLILEQLEKEKINPMPALEIAMMLAETDFVAPYLSAPHNIDPQDLMLASLLGYMPCQSLQFLFRNGASLTPENIDLVRKMIFEGVQQIPSRGVEYQANLRQAASFLMAQGLYTKAPAPTSNAEIQLVLKEMDGSVPLTAEEESIVAATKLKLALQHRDDDISTLIHDKIILRSSEQDLHQEAMRPQP